MKTHFTLLMALLAMTAFGQRFDWASTGGYVGIANSFSGAIDIARDPAGNIYTMDSGNLAQQCQGDTLQPFGSTTTFIYKFDPQGNLLFINRVGAPGGGSFIPFNIETDANGSLYLLGQPNGVTSIIVNQDTVAALGNTNQLIKIDPNGNFVWKKNTGFASSGGGCMLQYSNGFIYYQAGSLSVNNVDTAGNEVAALTASYYSSQTSSNGLVFKGSAVFSNGDLLLAAISRGQVAYDTDTLFNTGNPFLTMPILLVRCDENMNLIWARYASNVRDPDQNFIPVSIDNNDAIYAAVQVNQEMVIGDDTIDNPGGIFIGVGAIIKIDASGNDVWARALISSNTCLAWCMQNMPDNSGIMLGGGYTGNAEFGSVMLSNGTNSKTFIAKIDYNGNFTSAFSYLEVPAQTDAKCLASDDNGVFYVGGKLPNLTVPVFSCTPAPGNNGFYLGAFTEQPDSVPTPSITADGPELTANPLFSGAIQWYLEGIAIQGATGQIYTATQPGNYTVTYEYTSGCIGIDSSAVVNVAVTRTVDGRNTNMISVYPNPSQGQYHIAGLDQRSGEIRTEVRTALGTLILSQFVNGSTPTLDLGHAPAGIYFLTIRQDSGFITIKLVKN